MTITVPNGEVMTVPVAVVGATISVKTSSAFIVGIVTATMLVTTVTNVMPTSLTGMFPVRVIRLLMESNSSGWHMTVSMVSRTMLNMVKLRTRLAATARTELNRTDRTRRDVDDESWVKNSLRLAVKVSMALAVTLCRAVCPFNVLTISVLFSVNIFTLSEIGSFNSIVLAVLGSLTRVSVRVVNAERCVTAKHFTMFVVSETYRFVRKVPATNGVDRAHT